MKNKPLCEARLEGCTIQGLELHHKKKRHGDNLFKYFCSLCNNCHRFIEENPQWSYINGFSIPINSKNEEDE